MRSGASISGTTEGTKPSHSRPVRVFARTPSSTCKKCDAIIYWSIDEFSGRNVDVSIVGEGAVAPTTYAAGVGRLHKCSAIALLRRPREFSPL